MEADNDASSSLQSISQKYQVKLVAREADICDIINDFLEKNASEEAFYIIDIEEVIERYNKWCRLLPSVEPYYAVKCNPDPVIIEVLSALGSNFDCASKNEIKQVTEATGDANRIIFANPCKMSNQIKYARANDVDIMTFDSDTELYKVKLYHPYAKLLLRIAVDDSMSRCRFNKKFGCEMKDVVSCLGIAKTLKLNVVGVSFHVGSGCSSPKAFGDAIRLARKVFDIGEGADMGFTMNILDIGGGFPGIDTDKISFGAIAEEINTVLNTEFGSRMVGRQSVSEPDTTTEFRVIGEPGRYMVQSSHTLVLNIIGKREKTVDGEKVFIYYLNDGVYGSFNCIYFDGAQPSIQPYNERNEKKYKSVVFGPTCDSLDTISEFVELPELAVGEWVYVENFGAYTTAAASSFNGFSKVNANYIWSCL